MGDVFSLVQGYFDTELIFPSDGDSFFTISRVVFNVCADLVGADFLG